MAAPWDMVNACGSYPFMNQIYTIQYPDGKQIAGKLKPIEPHKQTVFKGDQVKILVGPDKGKVSKCFFTLFRKVCCYLPIVEPLLLHIMD